MGCVSSILPQRGESVAVAERLSGLQRALASDFGGGAPAVFSFGDKRDKEGDR